MLTINYSETYGKNPSDPYGNDHGNTKGHFCHWFSWESNQAVVTANKLCDSLLNRRTAAEIQKSEVTSLNRMVAGKKKKVLLQIFWMYTRAPWFLLETGKALEVGSHRRRQVETGNYPQLTCACFYFHSQEYTSPLTPAPTALCWGCLSPSCSARREESKEGGADEPASQKEEEKENEGEKEDKGRESEHTESEREKEKSVLEPDIDFSDRVFPVTKAGNSAKVKSLGYESLVNFKKHRI